MQILKFARNASWLAAERALRIVVSVVLLGYIARHLGVEQFGLLNYSIAVVSITITMVDFGMNNLLVRDLVKEDSSGEILGTAIALRLAAAFASIGLLLWYGLYSGLGPAEARWLLVIAALGNFGVVFQVFEYYFLARELARYNALSRATAFLASSALRVGLVLGGASVLWFAVAYTVEWLMIAVFGLLYYLRVRAVDRGWRFSGERAAGFLRQCWPEIIAGSALTICVRMDQIMLEALLNLQAVGSYTAGSRLSDLWYFLPFALVNVVFPAIVRSREQSQAAYAADLQKLFLVVVAVAYLIALGTMLFAPLMVAIIFGPEFEAAIGVLRLHIWSLVPMALGFCSNSWIVAEGRMILSLYRNVLGAVANAGLNWLLIPRLGAEGAALATVASFFIAFYLFDLLLPSTRHLFRMKTRALFLVGLFSYAQSVVSRLRAR